MRCPGQDMRYWKGDAAFEVGCPKCGAAVEFFKDENSRRCRRCSHSFPNPKFSFDCAQWCEYAEACLGVSAQNGSRPVSSEAIFASRLLTAGEDLFACIEAPETPAYLIFQHARELVSKEPCNPRLVLAAALVIELESRCRAASAGGRPAKPDRSAEQPTAKELLGRFGMSDTDVQGVYGVLQRFRDDEASPTDIETKIVCDAAALAELTVGNSRGELDKVKPKILGELKTRAGKERAQNLFAIESQEITYPQPQKNYQVATDRAFECLSRQSHEQLRWLGAVPHDGDWRLPVLNGLFEVRLSSKTVVVSDGAEVGPAWRILALHYLAVTLRPDRLSPQVTFDDLPTARSYGSIYRGRVIQRLCATAGRQMETLQNAANSLGGRLVDGGDAAFQFDVFPRVQVRLIWHARDEEFPASATLLLPENIESYFRAEDIVVMSEGLVSRLSGAPY